jgi:hypothetical protein
MNPVVRAIMLTLQPAKAGKSITANITTTPQEQSTLSTNHRHPAFRQIAGQL